MSHPTISPIAALSIDRANQVIDNVGCPWPAMEPERMLLVVLREHLGKHQAIQLAQLVELLQVSERVVKAMVSNLRLNFRCMIGASRDPVAGGYYLISSTPEAEESTQYLVAQALTMLRVVRIMRGRHATAELFGQIRIKLDLDVPPQENDHAS